jgi:site-specific DNA-adenine methylase
MQKVLPLGVPYMGSKRKYATDLINQILLIKPDAKYFYDVFGGGGAMSFAAMQKGLQVFYNEKQTDMVNFMRFIFDCIKRPQSEYGIFPPEYYQFIAREKFIELRNQRGNYAQFARICYSFGNKQTSYLFNPELEKIKHLAHNFVVFKCEKSLHDFNEIMGVNYTLSDAPDWHGRRLDLMKQNTKAQKRLDLEQLQRLQQLQQLEQLQRLQQLQQLERLQRLQQLQQLERLQQLEQKISFTNLDYKDVKIETPPHETIVYLDPPYRGTAKYIEGLDHAELDAWFSSLPCVAFMSEYNAPFKCIYEIETRSTLYSSSNAVKRIERLYINRNPPSCVS